ncbi:hypothetical protein AB6A40_010184 [Gnathostoma spinigerum]|uniref:Uncharacterized protein n=1 Tax=Gnathostoma spinigerum TaxID=75299 RepID=A0ABD6F2W8_9BILA
MSTFDRLFLLFFVTALLNESVSHSHSHSHSHDSHEHHHHDAHSHGVPKIVGKRKRQAYSADILYGHYHPGYHIVPHGDHLDAIPYYGVDLYGDTKVILLTREFWTSSGRSVDLLP